MAQLPTLFAPVLFFVIAVFGEHQQVILGDAMTFPATGKCAKEKGARLVYRVDQYTTRPVADLQQGVWMPSHYYKDRVTSVNSCVVFNRTVYSDTGSYELTCMEDIIQLDVVFAVETSVTERETAILTCYYKGRSVEWKRNGTRVLVLNCDSGQIIYGPGFEGRVSVSHDGCKQGDFSLTMKDAQLEDKGDYFCKDGQKKRGTPAAVRLTINPKETNNIRPTLNATQSSTEDKQPETGTNTFVTSVLAVAIVVALVLGIGLGIGLGWLLKSKCSSDSPGARGGNDPDVEKPLNSQSACPAQVNDV